ncbi:uncharacterized protein LOC129229763 [Uloborus diversus]|uniref:uncharacterized protein LOC129229763 n=1 Tax=Uloborus diversus TaxID=327109 RepID=UPI00240987FD|nr:uncharacterized protein LOC129229763 [Uloborus diversus]
MMNVLTDILCDTSSLLVSQSYKDTLTQSKLISPHDVSTKQGHLHILDSVSQISHIDRPLSNINDSSPSSIDLFNASSQIHIPSNIDSGFDDRSQVSVFSDQFPEIVPSWLTHDFMKVSDNLPSPGILSNVSDIYPSARESEHLEMLDLGFPPELTSQDVSTNLNRCIDDGQKLLEEMPMQRFSNDSLMIPSFNDIHSNQLHLSMGKSSIQYQKFAPDTQHVQVSSSSLMNSVMPCENDLLHLPLPSTLAEQCLNSSSSPSMSSQSRALPVNVVCDKLPQISLNHLDSLLDNETTLSDIHLLRHDFPHVSVHQENQQVNNCTQQTSDPCMTGCNPNDFPHVTVHQENQQINNCTQQTSDPCMTRCHPSRIIPCDPGNFLASQMAPVPQHQDASVQVPESGSVLSFRSDNQNCFSCSQVPLESALEEIYCFKCKFCDYINVHKCAVSNHISMTHSKPIAPNSCITENGTDNIQRSDIINSLNDESFGEARLPTSENLVSSTLAAPINSAVVSIASSEREPVKDLNSNFQCIKCSSVFLNINDYNTHLLTNHNIQPENVPLNVTGVTIYYQPILSNGILLNTTTENLAATENDVSRKTAVILQNGINNNVKDIAKKRKKNAKKVDDPLIKNSSRKTTSNESFNINSEKQISSHKKAWQKKMNREVGSYICEFKGCNVRFRALDNLEYHKKCHISGISSFGCPECSTSFESWGTIAGHLWRDHGNDMELHACDQCQFRTYSLSRLENIHKRTHKDEYLFLCDTCGKSFKTGKQLRNHRAIHTKKKMNNNDAYKCNICSIAYSSKATLRTHQTSVHNKVKRFLCDYCDYSAFKRGDLKLHMRVHTGEKPFECDMCQYKTSDHNSLRRHKQTHSGEKTYKCPYCSYSSIQASCYKDHLKNHHPGQNGLMFSCTLCPFRTLKQEVLTTHMSEHENSNRPQNDNNINEINSTDDIFPIAKALDMKSFSWCS